MNPDMITLPEPIALIDLDGTIADFDGAMKEALVTLRSPDEGDATDDWRHEEVPHIKARRRMIKRIPGFWKDLKPLAAGFEVLSVLQDLRFHCEVLSKGPANVGLAWQEKVEWCRHHVPKLPIHLSEDKGRVYGKVLVDDWPEYVERWIKHRPRGLVISVAQPWNEGIELLSPVGNIIRYTGQNMDEIRERLVAIRAKCGE